MTITLNPTTHDRMHRGSGCACDPGNWCGDVLALVDTGCDEPGGVCKRCMLHDPHEHRT